MGSEGGREHEKGWEGEGMISNCSDSDSCIVSVSVVFMR